MLTRQLVWILSVPLTWGVLVSGPLGATPIQDASLVMWLDGRDIDGDGVPENGGENYLPGGTATWVDKSTGGTNTATQSTGGQQPTLTASGVNGLPYLAFDGGDTLLFSGIEVVSSSVFVVAQNTGATGNEQLLGGNASNRQYRYRSGATSGLEFTGAPDNLGVPQFAGTTTSFNIAQGEVTGSTARVGLNGSFGTLDAHSVVSFTLQQVGARNGLAEPLTGNVAEVIAYNSPLNSAERIIVENYLNAKFDIDSDGSSPIADDRYAGDLSANGDYDFEVIGVGSESDGSLTSSASGGLALAATGGLDVGESLLAGHTGTANGLTPAGMPAGEQRWERVWYLDRTEGNDDLTATAAFDWSDSGLVLPFDSGFNGLYYSPTAALSFSLVTQASSIIGDQVFFNLTAADLPNGYYTLGTSPPIPEPGTAWLMGLGILVLPLRRRLCERSAVARGKTSSMRQTAFKRADRRSGTPGGILATAVCGVIATFLFAVSSATAVPLPDVSNVAASDVPGNATWDNIGTAAGFDWSFGAALSPVTGIVDGKTEITAAYQFPAAVADTSAYIAGDRALPATFEMWFRPADLTGEFLLFEAGGSTGTGFSLDEDELRFVSRSSAQLTTSVTLDSNATSQFQHAVGVVRTIGGGPADIELYLNGALVDTASVIAGYSSVWAGTDSSGLGFPGGSATTFAGDNLLSTFPAAPAAYDGQIAIYNFYTTALSAGDIAELYQQQLAPPIPEPSTLGLLGLGVIGLSRRRRRSVRA